MPSSVYEVLSKERALKGVSSWLNALGITVHHSSAKRSHLEFCLGLDMVTGEYVSVSCEFRECLPFLSQKIFFL